MFAYCLNNPVYYLDCSGDNSTEIAKVWTAGAWWITLLDGPIPVADMIYILGVLIAAGLSYEAFDALVALNWKYNSKKAVQPKSTQAVSTPASPPPPNNNKNKDPKYRGGSTYNRDGVRVDYEYNGNGTGNVHIQLKNGKNAGKYYYNAATNKLTSADGGRVPREVQALLEVPSIIKAIEKALRYING